MYVIGRAKLFIVDNNNLLNSEMISDSVIRFLTFLVLWFRIVTPLAAACGAGDVELAPAPRHGSGGSSVLLGGPAGVSGSLAASLPYPELSSATYNNNHI